MKKSKKVLLKIGEGLHSHMMECKKSIKYEEGNDFVKLLLEDTGVITHEEHEHIQKLDKGLYISTSQQEWSPFEGIIRSVYD